MFCGSVVSAPKECLPSGSGIHTSKVNFYSVNILCSLRWRTCIQLAKTRPGADCGSDHQLHIANFRLKLKKTRKNTRPARYDLYQIPFEFVVAVMNRFKGLDLINNVPEEL